MSKIEIRITRPDKDKPEVSTVIEATVEYEWMAHNDLNNTIETLGAQLQTILSKEETTE